MQQAMTHAQRLDVKRTPYSTASVLAIETTPEGMFSSAEFWGEKPKVADQCGRVGCDDAS